MKSAKILILLFLTSLISITWAAPQKLTQKVSLDGDTITLQLQKVKIRGDYFEVLTRDEGDKYKECSVVEERSYIGTVDEYPGAISCGILRDDGTFWGKVYFKRGLTWITQGEEVDKPLPPYTKRPEVFCTPYIDLQAGHIGNKTYSYNVGVDASYSFYKGRANSDIAKTLEFIEFSTVTTVAIYMRDLLLRPYLGRIVIYTDPKHDKYYDEYKGTAYVKQYLESVSKDWAVNHADSKSDMVVAVSDELKLPNSPMLIGYGGLASKTASACGSFKNGAFGTYWRHEMAHSWGLGHYDGSTTPEAGPEGVTINSGNGYSRFSAAEVEIILNRRDAKVFSIKDEGVLTDILLPPYAALDFSEYRRGVDTDCIINVMANDHDANNEQLSLSAYDSISENGGKITRIGDNLIYEGPENFSGLDQFRYTIEDEAGLTGEGVVLINVYNFSYKRLHLPFDDNSDTIANDKSIYGLHGALEGATFSEVSLSGKVGKAINLNGVNQHVNVENIILNNKAVTLTAWINPSSKQTYSLAGLIFNVNPYRNGLCINKNNELAYIWNGEEDADAWNSGLIAPLNTWTFVALVVEPTKATMYINTGNDFQKSENITTHEAGVFSSIRIGGYPGWKKRNYKGAIDDVQIYSKALTLDELKTIFEGKSVKDPQDMQCPKPVDKLQIKNITNSSLDVHWEASQSNDADSVTVIWSRDTIKSLNAKASQTSITLPSTTEKLAISDLQSDSDYYLAVYVSDTALNWSRGIFTKTRTKEDTPILKKDKESSLYSKTIKLFPVLTTFSNPASSLRKVHDINNYLDENSGIIIQIPPIPNLKGLHIVIYDHVGNRLFQSDNLSVQASSTSGTFFHWGGKCATGRTPAKGAYLCTIIMEDNSSMYYVKKIFVVQ